MKRSEILEKLGDIENAKEICDFILDLNGKEIQSFKSQIAELESKHQEELKAKDEVIAEREKTIAGFDTAEFEALKTYKVDNEAKIKAGKEADAVKSFLKANNYSSDDVLLSYITGTIKPEFDEDFKITNSDVVLKGLEEKASQYKITEKTGGASATNPPPSKPVETDNFLAGFKS